MSRYKKFKNMQGYNIAQNMCIEIKRNSPKSDIHSYMALAELLGVIDGPTARTIINLGTEQGFMSLVQARSAEAERRHTLASVKPEHIAEGDKDENQDWSTVM